MLHGKVKPESYVKRFNDYKGSNVKAYKKGLR